MAVDFETMNRIARSYANDVRKEMPVDKAILFGSYAKGTATEFSDVDVCFFLRDYGGKDRLDIMFQLLKISRKYPGVFFEPLAFATSEIERGNPFVREILRTGQEI
jgi:predicted nucleotidyltransferase